MFIFEVEAAFDHGQIQEIVGKCRLSGSPVTNTTGNPVSFSNTSLAPLLDVKRPALHIQIMDVTTNANAYVIRFRDPNVNLEDLVGYLWDTDTSPAVHTTAAYSTADLAFRFPFRIMQRKFEA